MGKTSAFVAAYCSEPLAAISPRLPFIVAVSLSFGSFLSCCCYAWLDKSLPPTEEDVQEKEEHEHALQLGETKSFGDPFWLYQLVCAGGGIW